MQPDTPTIRLTVWRPARLGRRLLKPQDGTASVPFEDEQLHEEAYTWESSEDFIGSLGGDDAGKVRAALFESFAAHLPPSDRVISKLSAVIDALKVGCDKARYVGWKDVFETASDELNDFNLRANAARALLQHLMWVHDVFRDAPGASIIVR